MYPKLVAIDTDWTIFWGWLDAKTWGKGRNARSQVEDNIAKVNEREIHDRSNHSLKCVMYSDIPRIIQDIKKHGAKLAIVSRNTDKAMCDRALWYFHVPDENGHERPLIDLVDFDEVYNLDKVHHFSKIKGWTQYHYSDMILYDDKAINNTVEMMLGVTFQVSRDQKGLTWKNYQDGLATWRRNKAIHSPWHGLDVHLYPKRKLIGYSGMDLDTIKLLEAGGRRQDRKEAARWGYAMYVADNPAIAKYFSDWIKKTAFGPSAQTIVCAIYARDGEIFERMNKIWVPDKQSLKINVTKASAFQIAWSQEDRDRQVAAWGVQKPYILFARHPNMNDHKGLKFPVPNNKRWNEMVVYGQVQENLILTVRMSDKELDHAIKNIDTSHIRYGKKFRAWNITVPEETRRGFEKHGEKFPLP
ncbi:hypothetical protein PUNSTDRAFT_131326 [Punctularia strigosozonata HHB-11173 SS5]|uniref:uncharacterized protein n=1 Tax=Punctularia strigosozonata (strain HHB-11173) TaxID=741275 RepID=UPI00044162DC|nr:uncharacterized protein PUNSTDRAFT_131326 [Punctularia strigosozonata HHB-11173 SS5]EIN11146.1 hypothetical protein PUNSTDRAFT_131326 [Punctularia strigosozonata HHB-11173 SS5]